MVPFTGNGGTENKSEYSIIIEIYIIYIYSIIWIYAWQDLGLGLWPKVESLVCRM